MKLFRQRFSPKFHHDAQCISNIFWVRVDQSRSDKSNGRMRLVMAMRCWKLELLSLWWWFELFWFRWFLFSLCFAFALELRPLR